MRRLTIMFLLAAAALAASAMPAVALEYGTGSSNGGTHGYVVDDGLYAEGGTYNASGSELWSGIRTDEMQASGWSYNDNGTQTTGGRFHNDEMAVVGRTDNGETYFHVDLGEVCYGNYGGCGQD